MSTIHSIPLVPTPLLAIQQAVVNELEGVEGGAYSVRVCVAVVLRGAAVHDALLHEVQRHGGLMTHEQGQVAQELVLAAGRKHRV